MKLFDLAGAESARRFSPYCWRIKLALAHKGLTAETIPWRFTDKDAIAMSGQGRVPVLLDGDKVVSEFLGYCELPGRLLSGSAFLVRWGRSAARHAFHQFLGRYCPQRRSRASAAD
jgi:hypothetical protein